MKKGILLLTAILLISFPFYGQTVYLSAMKVTELNPKPNIAINNHKEKIFLLIDENNIQDDFVAPAQNGTPKTKISKWHTSLIKGFNNGFGEFFTIVDDPSQADFILKLSKMDMEWMAASYKTVVSGGGGLSNQSSTSPNSFRAQITFKAQLINNHDGEIMKQCAATAVAKKVATRSKEVNPATASALESVYEIIAKDLFE